MTYQRVVGELAASGVTQEEIGQVVGVSVRTVQNWAQGGVVPVGRKVTRLLDLRHIVEELREAYTDEGIAIWLHSRNRNLSGRRPLDLLLEGAVDDVLQEARRVSGAM